MAVAATTVMALVNDTKTVLDTPEVVELLGSVKEDRLEILQPTQPKFDALLELLKVNQKNKTFSWLIVTHNDAAYDHVMTPYHIASSIWCVLNSYSGAGLTSLSYNFDCYVSVDFMECVVSPTLTSLNFSAFRFTNEAVSCLVAALKTNRTLTSLSLDTNTGFSEETATALGGMLETNVTLKSLRFGGQFGNLGSHVHPIFKALKNNKSLNLLGFTASNLGVRSVYALKWLEEATNLTTLEIRNNHISFSEGTLSKCIEFGKSLTTLDLRNSNIKNLSQIANRLQYNTTLTTLDLRENKFNPGEESHLVEALEGNTGLTTVLVDDDALGSDANNTHASIKGFCERNMRLRRNWSMVAATLSSIRANREHTFRTSFLPLFNMVKDFAGIPAEPVDIYQMPQDKKNKPVSVDRTSSFLGTKYAQAVIGNKKRSATAAEPLAATASAAADAEIPMLAK